jgi:DNA-directed RNA polymerase subunit RPC12/RpoP
MNRSRAALARTGLQSDGGRPSCPTCGRLLQFGTDRQGRTTESCQCGYRGFVRKRPIDLEPERAQ